MAFTIRYPFTSTVWKYKGPAGWFFVNLPQELSKEIRDALKDEEQGWGRLKATAHIGNTKWETAIWFDTKANTYLLPIKAEVRKKEKIEVGAELGVVLEI